MTVVALTLAGCASGGGETHREGPLRCHPQGDRLSLLARNTAFDTECLAVEAETKFGIQFDNQDAGVQHNLAIFAPGDGRTPNLFRGRRVQGPAIVPYEVPALPAGSYPFRCEIHPDQMTGTLIVE